MATKNDTPIVDSDKDIMMDVRGIIDGCIDSGSTDYSSALKEIAQLVSGETDKLTRSQCDAGIITFSKG
jgi:hypothetical protein